jgi:hypothetical protein
MSPHGALTFIVVDTHDLDQLALRLGEIAGAVKVAISMVARTLKVTVAITSSCTVASIDLASPQERSILPGGRSSTLDQYATTYSWTGRSVALNVMTVGSIETPVCLELAKVGLFHQAARTKAAVMAMARMTRMEGPLCLLRERFALGDCQTRGRRAGPL